LASTTWPRPSGSVIQSLVDLPSLTQLSTSSRRIDFAPPSGMSRYRQIQSEYLLAGVAGRSKNAASRLVAMECGSRPPPLFTSATTEKEAAAVDPPIKTMSPAFATRSLPNCIAVPAIATPFPTSTAAMFQRVTLFSCRV
jgi:hypothetical protein